MFVAAVFMIIFQNRFYFAIGNELPGYQLLPIYHQLRTEIQISIVHPHGSAVCSVVFVIAEGNNDIRLTIASGIAKRDVPTLFWKAGLHIDVAVFVYSHVSCTTLQTDNDNDYFE